MFTHAAHPNSVMQARKPQDIKWLVIHYTGNNGDTARGNLNYFATANRGVGAHFFVDHLEACRSISELRVAGHCGRSDGVYKHPLCRNANSIGIEMCSLMSASGGYSIPQATQEHTAALVRALMTQFNIPLDHVIRHFDVTGKLCPRPMISVEAWAKFLYLVREGGLEDMVKYYESVKDMPTTYQATIAKLVQRGVIQGSGGGLHLSDDMCRVMVYNDRAGLYGS